MVNSFKYKQKGKMGQMQASVGPREENGNRKPELLKENREVRWPNENEKAS